MPNKSLVLVSVDVVELETLGNFSDGVMKIVLTFLVELTKQRFTPFFSPFQQWQ